MRSTQIRLLGEIKKKKEEAERIIDETQSSYQDSVSAFKASELASRSAVMLISTSHEVIQKVQALLRENERILELENKKMEELSVRNTILQNNLNAWHSKLDAILEEYNRKSAVTDEDLKRQALESVQSARLEAIEKSREHIRKLSQHD